MLPGEGPVRFFEFSKLEFFSKISPMEGPVRFFEFSRLKFFRKFSKGGTCEVFRKNFSLENSKNLTGPSLGKFSKKFQSRKFEKPHRSLPRRNFRKNFSLENSKNITGPSLGEIFENISYWKIRKTSQVPPLEKFSKKFQFRKFEKPHRSLPWRNYRKNFSLENSKNLTKI